MHGMICSISGSTTGANKLPFILGVGALKQMSASVQLLKSVQTVKLSARNA
jgi:hypothetical protein